MNGKEEKEKGFRLPEVNKDLEKPVPVIIQKVKDKAGSYLLLLLTLLRRELSLNGGMRKCD